MEHANRFIDLINDLLDCWDPTTSCFLGHTTEEIAVIMNELEKYTTNIQYEEVAKIEEELTDETP